MLINSRHSLGGATAANVLVADPRAIGGLNMDGSLFGPITTEGCSQPFLEFDEATHTHFTDPSLNVTWSLLQGWHEELGFNGTKHSTFGDLAFLVHVLGLSHSGNESQVVGTVDGLRAMGVESAVITEFFDFVFTGKESKLLNCDNDGYPEIACVTTCIPGYSCNPNL